LKLGHIDHILESQIIFKKKETILCDWKSFSYDCTNQISLYSILSTHIVCSADWKNITHKRTYIIHKICSFIKIVKHRCSQEPSLETIQATSMEFFLFIHHIILCIRIN